MAKQKQIADTEETVAPAELPALKPGKTHRIIKFHADWCHGCADMDKEKVFEKFSAKHPEVQVEKVDIEASKANDALADFYEVENLPTIVIEDAEGTELHWDDGQTDLEGLEEAFEKAMKKQARKQKRKDSA